MSLHPVLAEKLSVALEPAVVTPLTRRDARLPAVTGKAHAVIGMRRALSLRPSRFISRASREGIM